MAPHNSSPSSTEPPSLYPFNPCGHLRAPDGGCIGHPECKQEPAHADQLAEIQRRASELLEQLQQPPTREDQTGAFLLAQLTMPGAVQLPTAEGLSSGRVSLVDNLAAAEALARALVAVLLVASHTPAARAMPDRFRRDLGIVGEHLSMRLEDLRCLHADALVLLRGGAHV